LHTPEGGDTKCQEPYLCVCQGQTGGCSNTSSCGGLSWNNRQSCGGGTFIVGARVLRVHVCVCVRACSLARLPSNHPVGFHEVCSEDMTDKDGTEYVITLCCIVHWFTKGKSTECRDISFHLVVCRTKNVSD
jgi:hypothetical protein